MILAGVVDRVFRNLDDEIRRGDDGLAGQA
jgi:hypothetical protein